MKYDVRNIDAGMILDANWVKMPIVGSLRDHFADTALSKLIARNRDRQLMLSPDECAEMAYSLADAMMKAREARR